MAPRQNGLSCSLPITADSPVQAVCCTLDLGKRGYQESLAIQSEIVQRRKCHQVPDCLLFVEYSPVFTLGRAGKIEHLLASHQDLETKSIEFYASERGGDITYHGPGQLIAYPVLDLKAHLRDIDVYLRNLERCIIETLKDFGIISGRINGLTGVWVGDEKIAAIGVRTSQWVTSHGLALNVNTDLCYFDLIVPCGILGKRVTSMAQILKVETVELSQVKDRFCYHFARIFSRTLHGEALKSLIPRESISACLDTSQGDSFPWM